GSLARARGVGTVTAIIDSLPTADLRAVPWRQPATNTPADWLARAELWQRDDVLLGGSDAGAHLDRILGSPYPTKFIGDTLRGRRLVPLERAVQLLTDVPARWVGMKDRGRLAEASQADVVVFARATAKAEPPQTVLDLPGESKRLLAGSIGVEHVFVNGVETVTAGRATGATAGVVLRSTTLDTVDTSNERDGARPSG